MVGVKGTQGHRASLGPEDDRTEALNKVRSAASVSVSPELFEKAIFLSAEPSQR